MSKALKFHSEAHVRQLIHKAFASCHSDGDINNPTTRFNPYSMTRLAIFLGMDRLTFLDWETQRNNYVSNYEEIPENRLNPEFSIMHPEEPEDKRLKDGRLPKEEVDAISNAIKDAKAICELYLEDRLLNGTGNVIGPIFVAKNNYNWADRTEILSINNELAKNGLEKIEDKEDLKAIADLLSARKRERQASNVVPIRKQVVNS